MAKNQGISLFAFLKFQTALLTFSFFADMVRSQSKFTKAVRAARKGKGKGKVVVEATNTHAKRAHNTKEVIMLPPSPPSPPVVEESALF